MLDSKLQNIVSKLDNLSKQRSSDQATKSKGTEVKRWKYIQIKKGLDESIEKLTS